MPVLAIIFAVARGFGFGSVIEEQLRNNIHINPDISDTVLGFIDSYLEHTHGGVFLGVGLIGAPSTTSPYSSYCRCLS